MEGGLPARRSEEANRVNELAQKKKEQEEAKSLAAELATAEAEKTAAREKERSRMLARKSITHSTSPSITNRENRKEKSYSILSSTEIMETKSNEMSEHTMKKDVFSLETRGTAGQGDDNSDSEAHSSLVQQSSFDAVDTLSLGGWEATPESTPLKLKSSSKLREQMSTNLKKYDQTVSLIRSATAATLAYHGAGEFTAIADGNSETFTDLICIFNEVAESSTESKIESRADADNLAPVAGKLLRVDIRELLQRVYRYLEVTQRQHILSKAARVSIASESEHTFEFVLREIESLIDSGITELELHNFMAFFGLGGDRLHDIFHGLDDNVGNDSDATMRDKKASEMNDILVARDDGSRGYDPQEEKRKKSEGELKYVMQFEEYLSKLRSEGSASQKIIVFAGCGQRGSGNVQCSQSMTIPQNVTSQSSSKASSETSSTSNTSFLKRFGSPKNVVKGILNDTQVLDIGTMHWTSPIYSHLNDLPSRYCHTLTICPEQNVSRTTLIEESPKPLLIPHTLYRHIAHEFGFHNGVGKKLSKDYNEKGLLPCISNILLKLAQSYESDRHYTSDCHIGDTSVLYSDLTIPRSLLSRLLIELFPPDLSVTVSKHKKATYAQSARNHMVKGYGRIVVDRCVRLENASTRSPSTQQLLHINKVLKVLNADDYIKENITQRIVNLANGDEETRAWQVPSMSTGNDAGSLFFEVQKVVLKQKELIKSLNAFKMETIKNKPTAISLDSIFIKILFLGDEDFNIDSSLLKNADANTIIDVSGITPEDIIIDLDGDDGFLFDVNFCHIMSRHHSVVNAQSSSARDHRYTLTPTDRASMSASNSNKKVENYLMRVIKKEIDARVVISLMARLTLNEKKSETGQSEQLTDGADILLGNHTIDMLRVLEDNDDDNCNIYSIADIIKTNNNGRNIVCGQMSFSFSSFPLLQSISSEISSYNRVTLDSFKAFAIGGKSLVTDSPSPDGYLQEACENSMSVFDARSSRWFTISGSSTNTVPRESTWFPCKRFDHSAVHCMNSIIIFGGRREIQKDGLLSTCSSTMNHSETLNYEMLNDVALYNVKRDEWTQLHPLFDGSSAPAITANTTTMTPKKTKSLYNRKQKTNAPKASANENVKQAGVPLTKSSHASDKTQYMFLPEGRAEHSASLIQFSDIKDFQRLSVSCMVVIGGLSNSNTTKGSFVQHRVLPSSADSVIDVIALNLTQITDVFFSDRNDVWWFRPKLTGFLPAARSGHSAAVATNAKNETSSLTIGSDLDQDKEQNEGRADSSSKVPSIFIFGGKKLVSNGSIELTNELLRFDVMRATGDDYDNTEAFGLKCAALKASGPCPPPRYHTSMEVVGNNRIIIVGGCVHSMQPSITERETFPWIRDVWIYSIEDNIWHNIDFGGIIRGGNDNFISGRFAHASALIDYRRIKTRLCTLHPMRNESLSTDSPENSFLYIAGDKIAFAIVARDDNGAVISKGAYDSFTCTVEPTDQNDDINSALDGNQRKHNSIQRNDSTVSYHAFNTARTLLNVNKLSSAYVEKASIRLFTVGAYLLSVCDSDKNHIRGSPFTIIINSSDICLNTSSLSLLENCGTSIEGISDVSDGIVFEAEQKVSMTALLRDKYGNAYSLLDDGGNLDTENVDVEATITHKDSAVKRDVQPEIYMSSSESEFFSSNTLKFTFNVPTTSGYHIFEIRRKNVKDNSCLKMGFDVSTGCVDTSKCTLSGKCLTSECFVGTPVALKIYCRDKHGNRIFSMGTTGSDQEGFVGYYKHVSDDSATTFHATEDIQISNTNDMEAGSMKAIGGGVFLFNFTPKNFGKYMLFIFASDEVSKGSSKSLLGCCPITINVCDSVLNPSESLVEAPTLHGAFVAGDTAEITVTARDGFGQCLNRGGDFVRARVLVLKQNSSRSDSSSPVTMTRNKDSPRVSDKETNAILLHEESYKSGRGHTFQGKDNGDGTYTIIVKPTLSGKLHVLIEAKAVYGADKNTTSCAAEMSLPLYEGFQICPFNRTNDTNEDEKKISVCAIDCIAGPVCPFQCTAAGLGISGKGQARSTNVFTVMTRDEFGNRVTSGGANIAVDIYGGWGVMVDWKGAWKDNGDGTYDVWYHPSNVPALRGSTMYEISVVIDNEHIMYSPFYQAIQPLQPYSSMCEAVGLSRDGMPKIIQSGQTIEFIIVTKDKNGSECSFPVDGLDVTASNNQDMSMSNDSIYGAVHHSAEKYSSPSKSKVKIDIKNLKNGKYMTRLSGFSEDHYNFKLSVRLYGNHINGSPFDLSIVPSGMFNLGLWSGYRIQDENIVKQLHLEGEGLTHCVCGEEASFEIISLGGSNNDMLPPEAFLVELVGPNDMVVVGNVTRYTASHQKQAPSFDSNSAFVNKQRCLARYVIEKAGSYTLRVKVSSYLVGGYPLLVEATANVFETSNCGVEMSSSVYKGEDNTIIITPRDRFGNSVHLDPATSKFFCFYRGGGERDHKTNKAHFIPKTKLDVSSDETGNKFLIHYSPPICGIFVVEMFYKKDEEKEKELNSKPVYNTVIRGRTSTDGANINMDLSPKQVYDENEFNPNDGYVALGRSPYEVRVSKYGKKSPRSVDEVRRMGKIAFIRSITDQARELASQTLVPVSTSYESKSTHLARSPSMLTASLFAKKKSENAVFDPDSIVDPKQALKMSNYISQVPDKDSNISDSTKIMIDYYRTKSTSFEDNNIWNNINT